MNDIIRIIVELLSSTCALFIYNFCFIIMNFLYEIAIIIDCDNYR